MISTKKNPFHKKNIYIKFDLDDMKNINTDTFKLISEENHAPLQMMVGSSEIKKKDFIKEHGFKKMRTCYSLVVSKDDMLSKEIASTKLLFAKEGEAIYDELAKIYYNYYKKKHERINPLTVDFNEFNKILPNNVYYNNDAGLQLAFVEDNELAYVFTPNPEKADKFYLSLCDKLFDEYREIFFEADDVDESAMKLKNLFSGGVDEITETWIFSIDDK